MGEKNEPKTIPHNIFSFTVDLDVSQQWYVA